MRVSYCERWARHHKEMVNEMSSQEAERLHRDGGLYTAVFGEPARPDCFVEVNRDFYGVSFLDGLGREYLMYTFEETGPESLFLKEAIYREFKGDSDAVLRGTAYRFSVDGSVSIEKSEEPFKRSELTRGETDVRRNWMKKPAFGDYDELIKKERLS